MLNTDTPMKTRIEFMAPGCAKINVPAPSEPMPAVMEMAGKRWHVEEVIWAMEFKVDGSPSAGYELVKVIRLYEKK